MRVIYIITLVILVLGFVNKVEPKTTNTSSLAMVQDTIARDNANIIGER